MNLGDVDGDVPGCADGVPLEGVRAAGQQLAPGELVVDSVAVAPRDGGVGVADLDLRALGTRREDRGASGDVVGGGVGLDPDGGLQAQAGHVPEDAVLVNGQTEVEVDHLQHGGCPLGGELGAYPHLGDALGVADDAADGDHPAAHHRTQAEHDHVQSSPALGTHGGNLPA